MADFENKLHQLSQRGNPIGAEVLIERIEAEMAGDPVVVLEKRREGLPMTKTVHKADIDHRQAENLSSWRPIVGESMSILAIASAVFLILVTAIGIGVLNGPAGPGGVAAAPTPLPETVKPSDTPETATAVPGLPPEGVPLSNAAPVELVLRFEPSTPWMQSWLYADGRLITFRHGSRPAGAGEEYVGLVEQRLTPDGVEFLTSAVLETGLFESDLALLWEGSGFLKIDVRNGDRLVQFGWGHRLWGGPWLTAPNATPAQAQALDGLSDLLSDQGSWPVTAWSDRAERSYVPPSYGICVRGVPDSPDTEYIWALLPQSAQDLIDRARGPGTTTESFISNCTPMSTADARALARILVDAGIERQLPFGGEIWLRYAFDDPGSPGRELWISFGPILPHGEAVWLGPG